MKGTKKRVLNPTHEKQHGAVAILSVWMVRCQFFKHATRTSPGCSYGELFWKMSVVCPDGTVAIFQTRKCVCKISTIISKNAWLKSIAVRTVHNICVKWNKNTANLGCCNADADAVSDASCTNPRATVSELASVVWKSALLWLLTPSGCWVMGVSIQMEE